MSISHLKELAKQPHLSHSDYRPLDSCKNGWTQEEVLIGREAVEAGKVGVVLMAGGQGSRFGSEKIKGCIPISLFKKKSLFQILAEKVQAASKLAKRPLFLAIMTSPLNHDQIINYFKEHDYFGLSPEVCSFFSQDLVPLLDENQEPFYAAPDALAQGSGGNGAIFEKLVASKIADRWQESGIEAVQVLAIDNVLAMPFSYGQIGVHVSGKNDATFLVCKKREANEKLGNVVLLNDKIHIIEYTELPQDKKEAMTPLGEFVYQYLNLGMLIFSLSFIYEVSRKRLSYHVVRKASPRLVEGRVIYSQEPFAYKFEKFIFDAFVYARKVEALLVDRDEYYAPLKNLIGEDSIESVQKAQLERDRQIYGEVTGCLPPPESRLELSQEFYYPTEEFLDKWRGKSLPKEGYIA